MKVKQSDKFEYIYNQITTSKEYISYESLIMIALSQDSLLELFQFWNIINALLVEHNQIYKKSTF